MFAGTIGVRRLLKLFEKNNMKATWFIPGHSLETFPEECALIRDTGHEIGLHGYSHENPADMTLEQQRDVLDKTYRMLTDFCGKPPRGSVAPWWETSKEGAELLLSYGIEYDHSMVRLFFMLNCLVFSVGAESLRADSGPVIIFSFYLRSQQL